MTDVVTVTTTVGPLAFGTGAIVRRGLKPTDVLYLLAGGVPV